MSLCLEILTAVGGNPLGLIEMTRSLSPDQRTGRTPLPEAMTIGKALEEAILGRVVGLDVRTRKALTLLAAAGETAPVIAEALEELGLSLGDLEPAEEIGAVVSSDGPAFAHPLYRTAHYQAATSSERRSAHTAVAAAGPAWGCPRQRWATGAREPSA